MPTPPPPTAQMSASPPDGDRQSASTGGRDVGKVSFSGLAEPCAIGSLVEVVVSADLLDVLWCCFQIAVNFDEFSTF